MNSHLGGHLNRTHVDYGVFDYIHEKFSIKRMLDIGCGPADMVRYARTKGVDAIGVDGDPALLPNPLIIQHDFYQGPFIHGDVDLIWSVEFLEHISKQHLPNVLETFKQAKIIVCTHALPHETGGHNHVNCETEAYWIEKFNANGFRFEPLETQRIRQCSTMTKKFMRNTGKVFVRL